MTNMTEETMRARFHELNADKERVIESLQPLQQRYDDIRFQMDQLAEELAPIRAELIKRKEPLFDIDMERAALARALKGKTGQPA